MAIAYRLDKTSGLAVVVWDGAVSGDDAEDHVRSMLADPDWPPGPKHLLDTSTATSIPTVANTKLVELIIQATETRQVRFALVATEGFHEATRFQRAAAASGVSQVVVFRDLSAACTWLGTDLTVVRPVLGSLRRELRHRRGNEGSGSN